MPIGDAVKDGLLTGWFFNWLLWMVSLGKFVGCNQMALWGLLILNDDGLLFQKCLMTGAVGAKAQFLTLS